MHPDRHASTEAGRFQRRAPQGTHGRADQSSYRTFTVSVENLTHSSLKPQVATNKRAGIY
jgi:hypothetical protein